MNWRLPGSAPGDLCGARILVVEDEPVIALDLAMTLSQCGALVVGPAVGAGEALVLLAGQSALDAAVLDVRLLRQMVWPVADALADCGIPFVLTTGSVERALPPAHADRPCLLKPIDPYELVWLLDGLCASGAGGRGQAHPRTAH